MNNDGKVNVYGGWVGLDGYLWALVTLCLHVDLDLDNILYGIALAQVGIEHVTQMIRILPGLEQLPLVCCYPRRQAELYPPPDHHDEVVDGDDDDDDGDEDE